MIMEFNITEELFQITIEKESLKKKSTLCENINNKNISCVRCTPVEGKSNQEEYSFKRYRTTYSEGKYVKG